MDGSRIPAPEEESWVRSKIYHCTRLSMNKNQTVDFLDAQLNIPPTWTRTIWEKVEEEKIERLNRLRQNGHQQQQRDIMDLPSGQYGRFTLT